MSLRTSDPKAYAAKLEKFSSRLESAPPARKLFMKMRHPWMNHATEVASAMKKANNGLERMERAILESMPDMILVMDGKGILKHFLLAEGVTPLLPAEKFMGKNIVENLPPDISAKVLGALEKLANSELNSIQYVEHFIPNLNQHREIRITRIGDNLFSSIVRDTTAQKMAQAQLVESQGHYSNLVNHMFDGYFRAKMIYKDGRPVDFFVLDANPSFEAVTGLAGVAGKMISESVPGIDKLDLNLFESFDHVVKTGKPEIFEMYVQAMGRHYRISAYAQVESQFMVIFEDITDLKNSEKSLKSDLDASRMLAESQKHYGSLINNMLNSYVHGKMIYENGKPVDFIHLEVNPAFEGMTGIKGVVGKKASEIMPGIRETDPEFLNVLGRVASTGKPELSEFYFKAQGRHHRMSIYSQKQGHFMAIFDDVTDIKNAEEEVRRDLMVDRAVADISKEVLSSTISAERVSDIVLRHAMELTGSRHGYVASINMETKEMQAHTSTKMLANGCTVESGKITFPKGADGYAGLWGHSLNTGQGFFTNEPNSHPASIGLPKGHVPMENFLSVPAMQGGEAIGQIALSNSPKKYTEKDLQAIQTLADIYSIALKRIELEQNLNLFKESVEKAGFAVKMVDKNGNISFINDAGLEMFGYSRNEIIGKPFSILHDETQLKISTEAHARMIARGTMPSEEIWYTKKDGTAFPALRSISLVKNNNEAYYVNSMMDITELKTAHQIAETSATLASLGLMTYGIGHEINNKLMLVNGYLELMRDSEKDPEKLKGHLISLNAVAGITSVIKNIQIPKDSPKVSDFKPFEVSSCVESAIAISRPIWHNEAGMSGRAIEISVKKPEAEVLCVGDFGLMQGVFQNLIINACHAMPEGGNIDISIEKKKSNIIISVRDNGTGIPEEVMPRIFEPFYTTKLTGKVRGTGLGLGIAKNSVLLHKGRINVDSTVGRGTKFTIVVPAYEEPIAVENIIAPGAALKADAVISEGIQKHAHVLVVDDEEPVADLAKLIIEMKGHNVTVANSGEEAIAILRENKQIDIVITDLNMTPLTGFDVSMEARRISEAEGRNIYVVLSSGGGSMIDKEDAASKGVGFFLDKPAMKKDYHGLIARIMGMKGGQEGKSA